ncbi:MAG: 50S ribosomal protein L21 [Candidatus Woykebacteria bacterium]
MKYAVFASGSKQYIASEGDTITVEKINTEKGKPVEFDRVLLSVDGDKVEIGKPHLKAKVKATVDDHIKDKKIRVFKYKAKTGYHKTQGHRQELTSVKIEKIEV